MKNKLILSILFVSICSISFAQKIFNIKDQPYKLGKVIFSEKFDEDLSHWKGEQEQGGTMEIQDGSMEIVTPKGSTIWLNKEFKGPIMIEYKALLVDKNGTYDRVSDLNSFWMATDMKNKDDIFYEGNGRTGQFRTYDELNLYYVGCGGHNNTKTRYRKYNGTKNRPLEPKDDLSDSQYLLEGNRWYKIQLVAYNGLVQYIRDGRVFYEKHDNDPYTKGWFGLRMVQTHQKFDDVKVYRLKNR